MNIILLTGPIASGKSRFVRRASKWFYAHNKPVKIIELDAYGHEVLRDKNVINCLTASFGSDLIVEGIVDVRLLATRAFGSLNSVKRLNRCTHPMISKLASRDIDAFLAEHPHGVVVIETPFPESYLRNHDFMSLCEKATVVVVDAPTNVRMQRCANRFEDAQKRDEIQQSYGTYEGDFVINNDSDEKSFDVRIDAFCNSLEERL